MAATIGPETEVQRQTSAQCGQYTYYSVFQLQFNDGLWKEILNVWAECGRQIGFSRN